MPEKIVIALGGNALQSGKSEATAEAQLEVVKQTCEYIADISLKGYEMGLVHGNGPQVGRILLASETAKDVTPAMPFDVCGAMSQGYIGYHLQQGMRLALEKRGKKTPVLTVVTQMVVDKNDPGFTNPTKPIGPFYSEEEAKALQTEKGYSMKEDAGRGWRRVVASPIPEEIVEIDAVKTLWDTSIVISCGGGGIPVLQQDNHLKGASAVIEKDLAAGKLAEGINADMLIILTNVEKVCINLGQPDEEPLGEISVQQAKEYMEQGHFGIYNMLPKFKAAVEFIEEREGRCAYITSFDKVKDALKGKTGTVIR